MTKEEFNILLKTAKTNKKGFAELLSIDQQTVNQWGTNNRKVPYWVKSWLENYIKQKVSSKNSNEYDKLRKEISVAYCTSKYYTDEDIIAAIETTDKNTIENIIEDCNIKIKYYQERLNKATKAKNEDIPNQEAYLKSIGLNR